MSTRTDFDQIMFLQNQDEEHFNRIRYTEFTKQIDSLEKQKDDDFSSIDLAHMYREIIYLEESMDKYNGHIEEIIRNG